MDRSLPRLVALLCLVASAHGHGVLTTPQPRNGASPAGDNKGNAGVGACGDGNQQIKGAAAVIYTVGQEVTLTWNCVIPHGGNCVISMDTTTVAPGTNDDGTYDVDGNGILTQHTLAPSFPCCNAAGPETMAVTIPRDAACENCVLQWFWDGDQNYYDCSDITVNAIAPGADAPAALLSPQLPGVTTTSSIGIVISVFVLLILVGLFGYRIKLFNQEEGAIYESFTSGWPTRNAVCLRTLLLVLRLVCAGLLCAVPSFYLVQSMLLTVAVCIASSIKAIWVLYRTATEPDRFDSKSLWYVMLTLDFLDLGLMTYAVLLTTVRKYATWVIADDQGESAELQQQLYYAAIGVGWLLVGGLSWQLVHSLAMIGCCIPGEGLLEAGDKEVAFLAKKTSKKTERNTRRKKRRQGRSSKGSSRGSSTKGSSTKGSTKGSSTKSKKGKSAAVRDPDRVAVGRQA